MVLAITLRKVLMALLTVTILILMLYHWNQSTSKPPSIISTFERSIKNRPPINTFTIPTEKTWTYKCEGDRCIRYHYLTETKNEKRIPFMTCSMTCGDINIWPHPTIKSAFSSKSIKFNIKNIKLKIVTLFKKIEKQFRKVFDLFLQDLHHIHSLDEDIKDSSEDDKIGPPISFFSKRKSRFDIDSFKIIVHIIKSDATNLNLDTDESYNLTTEYENRQMLAKIYANSFYGARHAISTLQQMIWYDNEHEVLRIISKSVIEDKPKFRYRGLMLDTSRHYFSIDAIKRTLDGMSYSKLNRFHWHITDSQSFPFVSIYYPELAAYGAYSERETYTHDDIIDIISYAKLRGIQVIPEIDAPAHAGNGWEWGPKRGLGELSLCINQQPWNFYCGEPPCGQLNPKNNNTYFVLQKLYKELLNLTGETDIFHMGGDEVNLDCWRQYFNDTDLQGLWCDFMLQALNRLKLANNNTLPKYIIVWSSGLTNTKCLSKNQFAVQVWGGSTWQENYDLIDNGFNIIISHVDAWYLDCGFGRWRTSGDAACSPYRTWQNIYKHRPWDRMRLDTTRMKQIFGGEACMWTEQVDESTLDSRLWPRTAALGERLWTDPDDENDMDSISQEVFSRMSVFRNRLVELGIKAEPIFPKYCAQNQDECI